MGYLIPRIVEDILAGHLSVDLTARYLNHMTKLMLCWSGQLALVDKAHLCKMTLYVRGAGMSLARIEVDTVALTYTRTYLHPDQLGSATAGTSQSGAVLWREQYAPYGDKLTAPAANDDLGSFTGHIDDDATTDMNLTYMQARYYDPGAGRFTSIDPVTFLDTMEPGMVNRYAYTMGDPVNNVDPDGNYPINIQIVRPPVAQVQTAVSSVKAGKIIAEETISLKIKSTLRKSDPTMQGGDKHAHFVVNARAAESGVITGAIVESLGREREERQLASGENTPEGSAQDAKANVAGNEFGESLRKAGSSSLPDSVVRNVIGAAAEAHVRANVEGVENFEADRFVPEDRQEAE